MNYLNIYNQIIEKAKNRTLEGYSESHHIIPKCLGGKNTKDNLVNLTAKEHFLCHKLLCEIYPEKTKLWYALWLMAVGKQKTKIHPYKIGSREYEMLKLKYINKIKNIPKPTGFNKGRKITWGAKIGIALKGKAKPTGFNQNNPKLKGRVINNKKVCQYDLQGNFIQEWESGREIWRQLGIHYGSISSCCKGKTKTAGNYVWRFKN